MTKNTLSKSLNNTNTDTKPERMSTSVTDNQRYPQVCLDASNNYHLFNIFRSNSTYIETLEHVSEHLGREYLKIISQDNEIYKSIDTFKENDAYGQPTLCNYPDVGEIAPTTLRYIKVLSDLKTHFNSLDNLRICEIGVGYGGQSRIINSFYKPNSYRLVDIQPALSLCQRYLDNYIINSELSYKTMNELPYDDYDLVISNYAFTELNRSVQDIYLKKIILRSKSGYITYNETTPPEFNSYKSSELIKVIPGAQILNESPLTHPNNCIIVWGNTH